MLEQTCTNLWRQQCYPVLAVLALSVSGDIGMVSWRASPRELSSLFSCTPPASNVHMWLYFYFS